MRVVLIHGKDTDPSQKWYPWFGEEVEKMGYEFLAPVLPKATDPVMDEWLAEVDKTEPDKETILVGHSRGGVAVLRWLENQPSEKRVSKVILVATNSGALEDRAIPAESNYGFYTENGYDFEKIKAHCDNFVVLHSKDDKWVPFSAGEKNAQGLSARFLQFDNYGHFGKGVDEIPELLEETIKYDARKALIVPINSKRQLFIQDRRGHKPPDWGYFGGEIE
jgi:predicted alpha/beta hydrolase family esterase